MSYKELTPEEAAALIEHGENIGFSGFTAAGVPKAVPRAIAAKAVAEHEAGRPFKVNIFSGASTSASADGALAEADAVDGRTPYQSSPALRKNINSGRTRYNDMHLSHTAMYMRYGHIPSVKTAIIEVAEITPEGEITLTTGAGNTPTYCELAERIIVEVNAYHPKELKGMHDLMLPQDPPNRQPIPLTKPSERVGSLTWKIDPAKVVGIVRTNEPDGIGAFKPGDPITDKIGENVAKFLEEELEAGRIPATFLPIQSGVGNIANAVLGALGRNKKIPNFQMYTEVIQDSVINLMKDGRCTFAGGCSLTVSDAKLAEMYQDLDFYKSKVLLRPQEISNNAEIVRRLGLICINTAIEVDLFGQVNSTHFFGKQMMNGIGGSGDFARNGYLTIFTCPSTAKGGAISSIVPMVSHHDHTEHDVDIIVTEYGVADLRGKCPRDRAEEIITKCVHPDYQEKLRQYIALTPQGHTPHCLAKAFEMHTKFQETGDMRNADFSA